MLSACSQYPPTGQASQVLAPGLVLKLPGGHGEHSVAPACGLWAPTLQGKHEMLPLKGAYEPLSHSVQSVPGVDCRLPASHLAHSLKPRGRAKPGGQMLQEPVKSS